jgi:hypothetical protein
LYCESEWGLPFASVSEKSGAALPTGGGSNAKAAVATSEVRTVRIVFVFINYLEVTEFKMVQIS